MKREKREKREREREREREEEEEDISAGDKKFKKQNSKYM